MSDVAIRAENLGKYYRLGSKPGRRDGMLRNSLAHLLRLPFRRASAGESVPDYGPSLWALRDVTFDIAHGDVVGLIGGNGAGKSTLLKILSRITDPTSGVVEINGRVGSLLEVGAGFHAELTGRENVFLSGAVLGMRRAEISKKFDEIVAFAEVERFVDTPVKRYSSGMYLRLAFAVAAHLEPEILLVDEVLAVGDIAFQRKCLGKMQDVSKRGRTVVFVSHNLSAVGRLCPTSIRLDRGQIVDSGDSASVIGRYVSSRQGGGSRREWPDLESAPGDDSIRIEAVDLSSDDGRSTNTFHQDASFCVSVRYRILKRLHNANVGFELRTSEGLAVLTSYDIDNPAWNGVPREPGVYVSTCVIPANLLNEGGYSVTLAAGIPAVRLCLYEDDVIGFDVLPSISGRGPAGRLGARRSGVIAPEFEWRVESVE
jgi:lipopolysaccharide transport system ATP-binding protein